MILVVSDTSPVRALNHLGLLHTLENIYGNVLIPSAVAQELEYPARAFAAITVSSMPVFQIRHLKDHDKLLQFRQVIDEGEAEAIALALEVCADFILIDELAGRAIAERVGLRYVGVLGVLLAAKEAGSIPAVAPLMDRLKAELNFFISERLYNGVRQLAGE